MYRDVSGPEIRTGVLVGGPSAEVELKKGALVRLAPDDHLKEACTVCQMVLVEVKRIPTTGEQSLR